MGRGFAHADDCDEAGAMCRQTLGADNGVILAVIGAAFGMPDDHRTGARIFQHFSGNIAGMGAVGLRVAVLAADTDARPANCARKPSDQRRRWADQDIGLVRPRRDALRHGFGLGQRRRHAVHLPVSGHQRPDFGCRHVPSSPLPMAPFLLRPPGACNPRACNDPPPILADRPRLSVAKWTACGRTGAYRLYEREMGGTNGPPP